MKDHQKHFKLLFFLFRSSNSLCKQLGILADEILRIKEESTKAGRLNGRVRPAYEMSFHEKNHNRNNLGAESAMMNALAGAFPVTF